MVAVILILNSKPELSDHHSLEWDESDFGPKKLNSFADYLAREKALFEEVDRVAYRVEPENAAITVVDRYRRGSLADPQSRERDWNRTFEWAHDSPRCAVLLLHGMSDSPYSMREIAESLHESGATVLGLRIPGHGTTPSGLVSIRWQEMAEVVRIAFDHLAREAGDVPLHIVGYSNGGALAVDYVQDSILKSDCVLPDSIVLVSPSIGVTGFASAAVWQARFGRWLNLDKLAWKGVSPEYDPFKYASFPVNAGDQVYRLTLEISDGFDRLESRGLLESFPPTLAFQSAVDATVSTPALIEGLFGRLPEGGHQLVLFDLNRIDPLDEVLKRDPREELVRIIESTEMNFSILHLANRSEGGPEVEVRRYKGGKEMSTIPLLGAAWPNGVYSLSHVSLPFSRGDPLYGPTPKGEQPFETYRLGDLQLRGERGTLQVSEVDQLRLRWNPFFFFLEETMLEFLGLESSAARSPGEEAASE